MPPPIAKGNFGAGPPGGRADSRARLVKDALVPHGTAEGVCVPSASWIVTAKAP